MACELTPDDAQLAVVAVGVGSGAGDDCLVGVGAAGEGVERDRAVGDPRHRLGRDGADPQPHLGHDGTDERELARDGDSERVTDLADDREGHGPTVATGSRGLGEQRTHLREWGMAAKTTRTKSKSTNLNKSS